MIKDRPPFSVPPPKKILKSNFIFFVLVKIFKTFKSTNPKHRNGRKSKESLMKKLDSKN